MKNMEGYKKLTCAIFGEKYNSESIIYNKSLDDSFIDHLDKILDMLDDNEKMIIRYSFNLDNEYKTYKELDELYKVDSKDILYNGLRKLKHPKLSKELIKYFIN